VNVYIGRVYEFCERYSIVKLYNGCVCGLVGQVGPCEIIY